MTKEIPKIKFEALSMRNILAKQTMKYNIFMVDHQNSYNEFATFLKIQISSSLSFSHCTKNLKILTTMGAMKGG